MVAGRRRRRTRSDVSSSRRHSSRVLGPRNRHSSTVSAARSSASPPATPWGRRSEFTRPGSFAPIDDMVGGGPFDLAPGEWTDDTSMAMCLAESLVERRGFDAADQMERYLRWWREGHWSSTGRCFDIGITVMRRAGAVRADAGPFAGSHRSAHGRQRLADASRARPAALHAPAGGRSAPGRRQLADDARGGGGGGCVPLLRGADRGRACRAARKRSCCGSFAPTARACRRGTVPVSECHRGTVPIRPARTADCGDRVRIVQVQRRSRDPRVRLCRPHARSGAVGVSSVRQFPRRRAAGGESRRGCRYDGSGLRSAGGAYYGVEAIPAEWRARLARAEDIERLATTLCEHAAE